VPGFYAIIVVFELDRGLALAAITGRRVLDTALGRRRGLGRDVLGQSLVGVERLVIEQDKGGPRPQAAQLPQIAGGELNTMALLEEPRRSDGVMEMQHDNLTEKLFIPARTN
jgi:hypothetical protein